LKDYGPCYGYWLFSFERYNGILGKYHTNRKSIEIQLMQTFLNDVYVRSLADTKVDQLHRPVFENLLSSKVDSAFNETVFGQKEFSSSHMLRFSERAIIQSLNYLDQSFIKLIPPYVIQKQVDVFSYLKNQALVCAITLFKLPLV